MAHIEPITLGTIKLNLLLNGDIEIVADSCDGHEVENLLNENPDYENGYIIRKIIERFDELASEIYSEIGEVIDHAQ